MLLDIDRLLIKALTISLIWVLVPMPLYIWMVLKFIV